MPNTVIALALAGHGVTLDIAVPLSELQLALQWQEKFARLGNLERAAIAQYFLDHTVVRSASGIAQPLTVQSILLSDATDENVGGYQELRIRLFAAAHDGFDPRKFTLAYDAVIHQVPNHFALVQITEDFRAGTLSPAQAATVGVIRYDFAQDHTPPLQVVAAEGSMWRGLQGVIALGFRHVALGYDHVLFLLTLLIIAPLRVVNGRWSLFQGWRYSARRFLFISIAFTLGHSLALAAGVYGLIPVPRALLEVFIAASIIVTSVHAIHPIFAGREWLVTALFGTVHGLAFSEALAGLSLSPGTRVLAVAGFNIGIELAQLTAMACVLPLLAASKLRAYHAIRISTMAAAAALAAAWMFERAVQA